MSFLYMLRIFFFKCDSEEDDQDGETEGETGWEREGEKWSQSACAGSDKG